MGRAAWYKWMDGCMDGWIRRNSVLEELRVRRLAVVQEEICSRAFVSDWCWSGNLTDGWRGRVACHLHEGGDLRQRWGYWAGLYTWQRAEGLKLNEKQEETKLKQLRSCTSNFAHCMIACTVLEVEIHQGIFFFSSKQTRWFFHKTIFFPIFSIFSQWSGFWATLAHNLVARSQSHWRSVLKVMWSWLYNPLRVYW